MRELISTQRKKRRRKKKKRRRRINGRTFSSNPRKRGKVTTTTDGRHLSNKYSGSTGWRATGIAVAFPFIREIRISLGINQMVSQDHLQAPMYYDQIMLCNSVLTYIHQAARIFFTFACQPLLFSVTLFSVSWLAVVLSPANHMQRIISGLKKHFSLKHTAVCLPVILLTSHETTTKIYDYSDSVLKCFTYRLLQHTS